jgi:hypothetical protein
MFDLGGTRDRLLLSGLREGCRRIGAGLAAVKFWDRDAFHLPGYYVIPRGENQELPADGWLEAWGQRGGQSFEDAILWAAKNLPEVAPVPATRCGCAAMGRVMAKAETDHADSEPVQFRTNSLEARELAYEKEEADARRTEASYRRTVRAIRKGKVCRGRSA